MNHAKTRDAISDESVDEKASPYSFAICRGVDQGIEPDDSVSLEINVTDGDTG